MEEIRLPLAGWLIPVLLTSALLLGLALLPAPFLVRDGSDIFAVLYSFEIVVLATASILYLRRFLLKRSPILYIAFLVLIQSVAWATYIDLAIVATSYNIATGTGGYPVGFTTYMVLFASLTLLIGYFALDLVKRVRKYALAAVAALLVVSKLVGLSLLLNNGRPYQLSGTVTAGLPISDVVLVALLVAVTFSVNFQRRLLRADVKKTVGGMTAYVIMATAALLLFRFPVIGGIQSTLVSGALVSSAGFFPLWGVILQEEEEKRKTIRLMDILNRFRPGLMAEVDSGGVKPQHSGLSILTTAFPDSLSFIYRSPDCRNWELGSSLEEEGCGLQIPSSMQVDLTSVADAGEQVVLTSNDDRQASRDIAERLKHEFAACIFMSYEGTFELTGVLRRGNEGWEQSELTFINNLSWLIKSEMASHEMKERQRMMAVRLFTLVEASNRLMDIRDARTLYDTVCELLSERLGYSDASIWENLQENGLKLSAWRFNESVSSPVGKDTYMPYSKGIISRCVDTCKPYLTGDVSDDPHYVALMATQTRSEYAVPIMLDGRCVAVLDIESSRADDFDTNDTQVIDIVSDLVSMVLKNIELYSNLVKSQKTSEIRADLLAHDLKNMFQPILLNMAIFRAKLASGVPLTTKDIALIENTTSSIGNAGRFVNNILQLVKLGNSQDVVRREMALADIIRSAIATVTSAYARKELHITVRLHDDSTKVYATDLVDEVFVNLFVNSVKYNRSDVVEITITSKMIPRPAGGLLEVLVADNGVGISPERAKTVFERFSEGASGSGIGLSLSKGIMESIGGAISVKPEDSTAIERGATFLLHFEVPNGASPEKLTEKGSSAH